MTPYGPHAWLITGAERYAIADHADRNPPSHLVEWTMGHETLLLLFSQPVASESLSGWLATVPPATQKKPGRLHQIPTVYDGPDLAEAADTLGLSPEEIVRLHSGVKYTVRFLGFSPGFGYLDGLPSELTLPRRDSPRAHMTAGAVAIGGSHTGIYSVDSPGGWNWIGQTSVPLLDLSEDPPFLLSPGDTVQFRPVSDQPPAGIETRDSFRPTAPALLGVLFSGPSLTYQGARRSGHSKHGIPPCGPMDSLAASAANELLLNSPTATTLEIAASARLHVLADTWLAHSGALACAALPANTARLVRKGEVLAFHPQENGLYSYIAVPGGWPAEAQFSSTSYHARSDTGTAIADVIHGSPDTQVFPQNCHRHLSAPPVFLRSNCLSLRLFPGPHIPLTFLCSAPFTVTPEGDRTGYQLTGPSIPSETTVHSLPVIPGCIQIPPSGDPIVTLYDGPTVGGYPIAGIIHPDDLRLLTQAQPGTQIRFSS